MVRPTKCELLQRHGLGAGEASHLPRLPRGTRQGAPVAVDALPVVQRMG
jgi:hypothetical protein